MVRFDKLLVEICKRFPQIAKHRHSLQYDERRKEILLFVFHVKGWVEIKITKEDMNKKESVLAMEIDPIVRQAVQNEKKGDSNGNK